MLTTAPRQLVLPFKRFAFSREDMQTHAVRGSVQGIGEIMEHTGDYFIDTRSGKYRLSSVIVHDGGDNAKSGHYWALIRKFDPATGMSRFDVANDDTVGALPADPERPDESIVDRVLRYAGNSYITFWEKID
jgi:hypothetical protein